MSIRPSSINQDIFGNFLTIQNSIKANGCYGNNCNDKINKPVANNQLSPETPKNGRTSRKGFNLPAFLMSVAGTLGAIALIRRYRGAELSKKGPVRKVLSFFNYGETDMKEALLLGAGAISGGLAGGIISDWGKNTKEKVKESIFQFNNIAIPTIVVTVAKALVDMSKYHKSGIARTIAIGTGLVASLPLAAVISNKINDAYIDKSPKKHRKLRFKDTLVHIDDIILAATLSKAKFAEALQIDKLLPFFYVSCGYESGNKK